MTFNELIEAMNGSITPAKIVIDMISLSTGWDPPEMILEGFYSRW